MCDSGHTLRRQRFATALTGVLCPHKYKNCFVFDVFRKG
jgi:hypothetical protein